MDAFINKASIAIPYAVKVVTTLPVLLGTSQFHQFCVFGCILGQIVSTLLLISIYSAQLTVAIVWWPLVELIRVCILGIVRVDRLIPNEANLFFASNNHSLYKCIALLNVFGFVWAFPLWLFYVQLSLRSDGEVSIAFFVLSFAYISLHITATLPSLSSIWRLVSIKLRQTEINSSDNNEVAYSFLESASIENQQQNREHEEVFTLPLSPGSTYHIDDHSDDPILQTAPMLNSNISSMDQLIQQKKNGHVDVAEHLLDAEMHLPEQPQPQTATIPENEEVRELEIKPLMQPIETMPKLPVDEKEETRKAIVTENNEDGIEKKDEDQKPMSKKDKSQAPVILMRFTLPNQETVSKDFSVEDRVAALYQYIDSEMTTESGCPPYEIVSAFPRYAFSDREAKLKDIKEIMGEQNGLDVAVSPMLRIELLSESDEIVESAE